MKLVSVLVPVYNAELFIERCARSLFEQTFSNIEFIFLNDCSSDRSMKILCSVLSCYPTCKAKTRIISNDRNMGISFSRNKLLDIAQGMYIYFVDSDDYLELNAIEKMYKQAVAEDADIVSCNYYEDNGNSRKIVYQKLLTDKRSLLFNAIEGLEDIQALWKLFVKRELFYKYGIKFDLGINICEDYVVTIKLFYYSLKVAYIKEPLYYYTVQVNWGSLTKNTKAALIDRIHAVRIVENFLLKVNQYDIFEEALLIRKLLCKQFYLINRDYFDLDQYNATFPEANKIWRKLSYGIRERILFWFAEHRLSVLVRLLYLF